MTGRGNGEKEALLCMEEYSTSTRFTSLDADWFWANFTEPSLILFLDKQTPHKGVTRAETLSLVSLIS